MKKRLLMLAMLLLCFAGALHAEEDSSEKSDEIEFPQWALDLRRAEIIGLGSMPFTTMGVTFFYGAIKYFKGESNSFPNPLDKNVSYDKQEIFSILGISFGVSALIALADFIIVKIERWKNRDKLKQFQTTEIITVVPATEEEIIKFKRQQLHIEDDSSEEEKNQNGSDGDSEENLSPASDKGDLGGEP